MANFLYRSQYSDSFCGQKVVLSANVSIGATGAPTVVAKTGMGILSVVRTGVGAYTITFTNPFAALLDVRVASISGSSAPAAPIIGIVANAVTTAATPNVQIQMRDIAAAAADPASGEILLINIDLDRSSLGH